MRSLQTALHALQTPHKKSLFSRNGFSSFNYSQKQKTVNGTQFKTVSYTHLGDGVVTVDGKEYPMKYKEALYVGCGNKEVTFKSNDATNPAKFYMGAIPMARESKTIFFFSRKMPL